MRRPVKWDEPTEWKFPVAVHSPSMEQLKEKFGGLEILMATSQGTAAVEIGMGKSSSSIGHPISPTPAANPNLANVTGMLAQSSAMVGTATPHGSKQSQWLWQQQESLHRHQWPWLGCRRDMS